MHIALLILKENKQLLVLIIYAARKSQAPSSPEPEHEEEEESPESPDPEHHDHQDSGASNSGDSGSNSGTQKNTEEGLKENHSFYLHEKLFSFH